MPNSRVFTIGGAVCLLIWALPRVLFAGPIVIGVIDKPSDLQHPMLAPYAATAALTPENPFYIDNVNGLERGTMELGMTPSALGRPSNPQALRSLLNEAQISDQPAQAPSWISKAIPVRITFGRSKKALQIQLKNYLHGTMVDSLAVNGLDPSRVKLEHFPLDIARASPNQKLEPETFRAALASWLDAISARIKVDNIRVVNLSFALDIDLTAAERALDSERQQGLIRPGSMAEQHEIGLQRVREQVRLIRSEFRRFFLENPQTAFVMAAGNEGATIDELAETDIRRIDAPNLLVVAATDYRGNLAGTSNRSTRYARIAAPGIDIPAASVGSGIVRGSGTSLASPLTVRQLARVMDQAPTLSGAEAIHTLLDKYTLPLKALRTSVSEGRFLLPPGKTSADPKISPETFTESDWIDLSCSAHLTIIPSLKTID